MYKDWGWQKMGPYLYYLFFTVCVIASFFTLSQCTIVVMFGPSRALKGDTTESVKIAADHMRHQMFTILKIAFIAVTALFLGVFIYCWSHTPFELAIPTSLLYIGGYYTVLTYGMHTYDLFRLERDITKVAHSSSLILPPPPTPSNVHMSMSTQTCACANDVITSLNTLHSSLCDTEYHFVAIVLTGSRLRCQVP